MSYFRHRLAELQPKTKDRRWLFVPYDQLSHELGPLSREDPRQLGIVLVENPWKAARRPYHKQKLALILCNLRHFALEQAARGTAVRHVVASGPYRTALEPLVPELGPLEVMEPAERELRADIQPLVDAGKIRILPHEGWLTTARDLVESSPLGPPYRMDRFYRAVRRRTGVLMKSGRPVGGKFSFDAQNRRPWRGDPPAPSPPAFPADPIKDEVGRLIAEEFPRHPGRLDLEALPATLLDALRLWAWAKGECLPLFGPYEDVMALASSGIFHTRVSSLVNIHRLLPARLVAEAEALDIPLPSKEGFIRQVLGWREFVRQIHRATDGFRDPSPVAYPVATKPGDGGYGRWARKPWRGSRSPRAVDGGACPSFLGADTPLPPVFWGTASGLACVDGVVRNVWEEGYSHHITRLMVLGNLATLLDVSPRELADWFWSAYTDAYDWVVEPNVLGMGTFGLGDLMTTKPYVSGAAYINRMSDYCGACAFNPRTNCPFTPLYWAFLARHGSLLRGNPRLALPLRSLDRRGRDLRKRDSGVFQRVRETLLDGNPVNPERLWEPC